MARYKVNCYYTYVGSVVVEADSYEEAYDKGFKLCEDMHSEDLDFVGYSDARVTPYGASGRLQYDKEREFND